MTKWFLTFNSWTYDVPLSQKLVRHLFVYENHILYWRINHVRIKKGDKVILRGDNQLAFTGKYYKAVEIISLYKNNRFLNPEEKIETLRNLSNDVGNLIGVKPEGCRYSASINHRRIGTFDTQQEAHEAYLTAYADRLKIEGEYTP